MSFESSEIIDKAMKEQWDNQFLIFLNNFSEKTQEHDLINTIKKFGEEVYQETKKKFQDN